MKKVEINEREYEIIKRYKRIAEELLVREKSFDGAREAWLKVWGKSKE